MELTTNEAEAYLAGDQLGKKEKEKVYIAMSWYQLYWEWETMRHCDDVVLFVFINDKS